MKQQAVYKIIGMQRDVADSGMDKQHAYDLHNMRLRHTDTNTVTALVNEIGNIKARNTAGNICEIRGTVIGTAVLNDIGIIFTHEEEDKNYVQVDTLQDEKINPINIADEVQDEQEIHRSPTPQTDVLGCCNYFIVYPGTGTSKEHVGNISIDSNIIAGTTQLFEVHIHAFHKTEAITENGVTVSVDGEYSAMRLRNITGTHTTAEQNYFVIPKSTVDLTGPGTDYYFTIEVTAPSTFEEGQHVTGAVHIIPDYLEDIDDAHQLIEPTIISFDCPIVAVSEPDEPEPDEPIPVDSGIPDYKVICDYEEETSDKKCDHIYLITVSERAEFGVLSDYPAVDVEEYFCGWLKFDCMHPIEATVYFENDEVKKVYWVDGKNPLRYANIADKHEGGPWTDNLMFDSVPLLHLQEHVEITRNTTGGVFPSGTVQWCFTYLNRYGAESNIAWISPIHYSSPDDRGGAPGENCSNSFTIKIDAYEPDGRFDYIRLYSIVHTTLDAKPQVRRIADLAVPAEKVSTVLNVGTEEEQEVWYYPSVVYTDSNTTGETVDPNELLYIGGVSIIPGTIEQKSNTLFLGNLTQKYDHLRDILNDEGTLKWGKDDVTFGAKETNVKADIRSGYYSHQNQLISDSWNITSFRRGEVYRFGFQAQDKTGHWSDVWWVCDKENKTAYPTFSYGHLNTVQASCTIGVDVVNALRAEGYQKIRPVVVYPEPWERNIFTEGLLNPTVYNVKDRSGNAPFAQSSWFLRPFPPINVGGRTFSGTTLNANGDYEASEAVDNVTYNFSYPFAEYKDKFVSALNSNAWFGFLAIDSFSAYDFSTLGAPAEYRHNYPLGDSQQRNGEVQSMYNVRPKYAVNDNSPLYNLGGYKYTFPFVSTTSDGFNMNSFDFIHDVSDFFFVDQSIFTMNSADIEFDQVLQAQGLSTLSFRVIGVVPISSFVSSYDIITNTPPNKYYTANNDSMRIPSGLYMSHQICADMVSETGHGYKSMINGAIWHDELTYASVHNPSTTVVSGASSYSNAEELPIGFAVYPWHGAGSLNNDGVGTRRTYPTDKQGAGEQNANESKSNVGDNYVSAELKTKILSNLHYSYRTHYHTNIDNCITIPAVSKVVLDTQQVALTKLDGLSDIGSKITVPNYFGSVDKLITPVIGAIQTDEGDNQASDIRSYPMTRKGGYPIMAGYIPLCFRNRFSSILSTLGIITGRVLDNADFAAFSSAYTPIGTMNTLTGDVVSGVTSAVSMKLGSDKKTSAISIKYKSCNHIVTALDYVGTCQHVFDWYSSNAETTTVFQNTAPFWDACLSGVTKAKLFNTDSVDGMSMSDVEGSPCMLFDGYPQGYLYMGQLYNNNVVNRFGGNSDEALEQNVWLPAGDAVYLKADTSASLVWKAGDTYYQRYDALRTYPFTEEDVNKVVDIVSFMTETHINIDGRYDRNRGLTNNNHCRPTNFNKINYVYSQRDNFFTYHALNPKKVHLDAFNYSFTWSLTKTAGALRDEWTRVTLANTYDCDGNKGSLNSITRLDNNLVAFQDGGVAQILFNENVQIQGSEGVPIELANSGKLQGLRYYTTEIGCQNKWSIAVFPNGIYWIDGRIREMCALGGDGIVQVSPTKLMSTWFNARKDLAEHWNPQDWCGFLSNSDKLTGEMFLTCKDTCLCFDTTAGEFSSFYDYQQTGAMLTLNGNVVTVAQDRSITGDPRAQSDATTRYNHLWLHRKNRATYCSFYGMQYPSYVEVVCNSNNEGSDYLYSKIFDNMSWRADAWQWNSDNSWTYKPFVTFTDLSGYDDYQKFALHFDEVNGNNDSNTVPQLSRPAMPINLRKKFKVWYTTFPRATGGTGRIRDTWCHIRLLSDTTVSNYRQVLHDLTVTYFIP